MITKIEKKACPACGSPLNIKEGNKIVKCEYCGNTVDLTIENQEKIEKEYQNCCIRFNCAKSKTDLINLLPCLKELGNYKDSEKMYVSSLFRINEFNNKNKRKRIIKSIVCITVVVCIFFTILFSCVSNKSKYNLNNIQVEIEGKRNSVDDRYFYVYLDYKITNNTKASIDYISVTTYIYKEKNKLIGSISNTFGGYGAYVLNLNNKENIIVEVYLSSLKIDESDLLFYELYNNSLSAYKITHKVTNVKFGDGKTKNVS